MDTHKQKIPSVNRKRRRIRDLTVMIMGRVGKVHSFKISIRSLLGASIFFLLYIPISVLFINGFFDLRYVSSSQSEKIKTLENNLFKKNRSLHRSKQYLALLEEYVQQIEKGQENTNERRVDKDLKEKIAHRGLTNMTSGSDQVEISPQLVDIKDLVIQKDGTRMTVNFKLVNLQSEENAVGGYIHIIARGGRSDSVREWTYPKEKLQNGVPENFRRGQLFLIQRFKPVYGKFDLARSSEQPSAIKVLVYDQAGSLILDKEFEVSNAS